MWKCIINTYLTSKQLTFNYCKVHVYNYTEWLLLAIKKEWCTRTTFYLGFYACSTWIYEILKQKFILIMDFIKFASGSYFHDNFRILYFICIMTVHLRSFVVYAWWSIFWRLVLKYTELIQSSLMQTSYIGRKFIPLTKGMEIPVNIKHTIIFNVYVAFILCY